jgi:hypothetical protein
MPMPRGSTYYNRDEWIVISANEIKHRDTLDILLSVGQVMTKHTIIMSKQDYDCLGPSQQAEIDASSSVASIAEAFRQFFEDEAKEGRLF